MPVIPCSVSVIPWDAPRRCGRRAASAGPRARTAPGRWRSRSEALGWPTSSHGRTRATCPRRHAPGTRISPGMKRVGLITTVAPLDSVQAVSADLGNRVLREPPLPAVVARRRCTSPRARGGAFQRAPPPSSPERQLRAAPPPIGAGASVPTPPRPSLSETNEELANALISSRRDLAVSSVCSRVIAPSRPASACRRRGTCAVIFCARIAHPVPARRAGHHPGRLQALYGPGELARVEAARCDPSQLCPERLHRGFQMAWFDGRLHDPEVQRQLRNGERLGRGQRRGGTLDGPIQACAARARRKTASITAWRRSPRVRAGERGRFNPIEMTAGIGGGRSSGSSSS